MKVFCTYCGAANVAGTRACIACGTGLPAPEAPPAQAPGVPGQQSTAPASGVAWPHEQPAPPLTAGHAPLWDPPRTLGADPGTPYTNPAAPYAAPEPPYAQPPFPPAVAGYPPYQGTPPYPGAYQAPGGWAPYPPTPPPYPAPVQPPPYPPPAYPPAPYRQPYPHAAYGQQPVPPGTPAQPYPPPYGAPPGYGAAPPYGAPPGAVQAMGPGNYAVAGAQGGPGSLAATLPRFGAFLFDLVVYGVTAIVLLTLAGALGLSGLGVLLALALHPLYYIGFWSTSGQTPGYRAAGLQLIKTDGTQPGVGAATVRYIGWHVSQWALYLGCLWMIWDYHKQTWHDKMAGTLVIRA